MTYRVLLRTSHVCIDLGEFYTYMVHVSLKIDESSVNIYCANVMLYMYAVLLNVHIVCFIGPCVSHVSHATTKSCVKESFI